MPNLLHKLADHFSYDLAIDLGSTNTLIYAKGSGIVLNEPSLIAFERNPKGREQAIRIGAGARELLGQHGHGVTVVSPVKHGTVADFNAALEMLTGYLKRIKRKWFPARFRVVANVPAAATDKERESFQNLIRLAGAREVYLIEEPRALAIGAGLDISEEKGNMVVDIGGAITEMAVFVGGEVVSTRSVRIGGEQMDRAIADYMQAKHGVGMDIHTAENIKISIGEACLSREEKTIRVKARKAPGSRPRHMKVSSHDVCEALSAPLNALVTSMRDFLQALSPALYVDVLDRGIVLAGGGAMLRGLDRLLEREIAIRFVRARDPLACPVLGCGDALDYLNQYRGME